VLDELADESVWVLMKMANMSGGLTDKGCLPLMHILQGDFDTNLTALPEVAFNKCIGGSGRGGNSTVSVNSTDGWAALSFINSGAQHPLLVTIDNHELYVFQIDGQYIVPTIVDQIAVGNGNRISVLVKLDQKAHRYAIRIAHQLVNQVVGGFAELVYDGATEFAVDSRQIVDFTGKPLPGIGNFRMLDETHGVPCPPKRPARSPNRTYKLLLKKIGHPSSSNEWSMSGETGYKMSEEDKAPPLLFEPPSMESDLLLKTRKGEWVDLIVETEGPISRYHPMHKHGNRFFVLGFGTGRFPWDTVEEAEDALPPGSFNFDDPPFLDTVQTKRSMTGAWLALRYNVEAPGAFLFHCHIQPHMTGGMGVVLMDGMESLPTIPVAFREWNGFEAPQIHH
jgi:FtsP/CotA-like multicopper oxidase with cupredoxin domain